MKTIYKFVHRLFFYENKFLRVHYPDGEVSIPMIQREAWMYAEMFGGEARDCERESVWRPTMLNFILYGFLWWLFLIVLFGGLLLYFALP